jgi:hypothetical protein
VEPSPKLFFLNIFFDGNWLVDPALTGEGEGYIKGRELVPRDLEIGKRVDLVSVETK